MGRMGMNPTQGGNFSSNFRKLIAKGPLGLTLESVLSDMCLTKSSDTCPTVSYDFVRHMSYGVLRCLMVSNKVVGHHWTP